MPVGRVAVIFDDRVRRDTTGVYCLRALRELVDVQHVPPDQLDRLSRHGFDLFLNIDDGLDYRLPADLRPSAWWVIDTHLNLSCDLQKAPDFDLIFAAQRPGAEAICAAGFRAEWLPLACDPVIHGKHEVPKTHDLCFIGRIAAGPRAELLVMLQQHYPEMLIAQRYFEEMARAYSASRLVFNRSVGDDINMRVFEALASGSLLLTNDLTDVGQTELFRDERHLATYKDAGELLDKVRFYLHRPELRERVAAAGRAEAVNRHTYRHRMENVLKAADRQICSKKAVVSAPVMPATRLHGTQSIDTHDSVYFEADRVELLDLVPAAARQVLDIGCGTGRLGAAIKLRQAAHVTGIELDPPAAGVARGRLDQVVQGNIEQLSVPWGPKTFDTVVCGDILEHLRDPAGVLKQIRTWLKTDGLLVASIPNTRHHSVVGGLLSGHWTYQAEGLLDRAHLRFFTRREIEKLLFRAGFRIESVGFVPSADHAAWVAAGRPGEIRVGPVAVCGLSPADAEDFHVFQYLITARQVDPRDDGLTSIIVVTHNQLRDTRRCLESLRLVTDEPYELIVIDNGSTDGTAHYLRSLAGVRQIANEDNRGFPAAANQGIRSARGRQLLLLNNDTVLTTGWLRRMLDALRSGSDVGLVGPCSDQAGGRQRVVDAYSPDQLDGFAWDWASAHAGERDEVDNLTGFCLLVRHEVFDRVGLLDEQFGLGCLEDDDLCLRARRAGFKCLVARDVFVRHLGHRSFQAAGVDQDALYQRNLVLFRKKWEAEDRLPPGSLDYGLTSIVIVTHNELKFTRGCLQSIFRATSEPFELVLVDNGSSDGTAEYLKTVSNATVIINPENRGFPAAANQGIRAATGRQVLLLNNDTVVPHGWLGRLLKPFAEDQQVGLVGPCSNEVSGEQRVVAGYTDIEGLEDFADRHAMAQPGVREPTDRLVGFCLLIRRGVIDQIGLLDEQFGLGCYEDDDYCRRTLAAGWKAVIAQDAYVHHYGGRTFVGAGVHFAWLMRGNEDKFRRKWAGEAVQAQTSIEAIPIREGAGPRVLLVAHISTLRDRMDRSHYLRYEALARRPGVTLFGPGLAGYRAGMTVREAVEVACNGLWPDVIVHGADLRESGAPLVEGLADAPCLTAIELIDSWTRSDRHVAFIRRHRFALGFLLECGPHLSYFQERCPDTAFHWMPNAVDVKLFRDFGQPKKYDVILYGNTSAQFYPLRAKLSGLLSRQSKLLVRQIPHPGYVAPGAKRDQILTGEQLSRAINEAWIGIATSSIYRALMVKHLEIPASGALLAGDLPDSARPIFRDDWIELHLGHSDEEIIAALQSALAEKGRLRERIEAARQRVVATFSTDAFADRVLGLLRKEIDLRKRSETIVRGSPRSGLALPLPLRHAESAEVPALHAESVFTLRQASCGLLLERRNIVLSLCMIARDNVRTIGPALESIRPWVDEMVVVDTGSHDETPAICERMGAHLFHFPWVDDFAAARNESVRLARGQWFFWMDSDDTIDPDCGRRLRDLVYADADSKTLGYVVQVRCPGPTSRDSVTVVDHVKLVRNRPELRFEGRIHEQILPAIRRAGGDVAWTDLFVTHSGYDHTPEGQTRKLDRDLRLLHLDLAERPKHPFVLFNLGMTYTDIGKCAEAAGHLRESIAVAGSGDSHLRKAYSLLVGCEERQGHWDAAWAACAEGLARFPIDTELRFRKGLLLHARKRLVEAAATYEDLLDRPDHRHFSSEVDGLSGPLARHNLALVYTDLGDWGRAADEWRLVLRDRPGFAPALEGLAEAARHDDRVKVK